jgi:hypothetical protein
MSLQRSEPDGFEVKTLPWSILRFLMSWTRNRCTGVDPPSVWSLTKNSPMLGMDICN